MKKVILVGYFQEMVELCLDCSMEIIGYIDKKAISIERLKSIPYLGDDAKAFELFHCYQNAEIIVTPDSPAIRRRLSEFYRSIGFSFATVVHPSATISPTAHIGEGSIIQKGVNVSADTHIGAFCRLNTHSNIMHDITIGDFSTIAPNAVILGYVNVGEGCYVGANSTILPNCVVGDGAIIGAGAVVTKDVVPSITVVGIPAKSIQK